ncbi:alpha/beta hydrolase [Flexivirga caeni]|uniref:Esterase n=1 Tax=Flexivirga caeni TaxID=2294115 RepID=A0A3M9M9K9_9MICO|nr:alpha/beta hydrolase-fold protein [Flexivirga caeni]RNI22260.1 esterase [Flexivirga caeni]
MSLLGKPFLVTLVILAVIAPVATLVLWPKARGPRALRVVGRLVLLGVCELTAVLLVLTAANDYGQFYSSWSDLLGTVHGHYATAQYGATAAPARRPVVKDAQIVRRPAQDLGTLQVQGVDNWSSPKQWRTEGKVLKVRITGRRSHLSEQALVYLPPEYFSPKYAKTAFPAVEALTGYPGIYTTLVSRLDYPRAALDLVRKHRAAPAIYVMMSSSPVAPRDTECSDVPGGPQAETYLSSEVPNAIERALRVRHTWGIIGDSTGGFCAAKFAFYQPQVFLGGVSLSGYYQAFNDWTTGDLYGGSLELRHRDDLLWMLEHRPAPPANLFLTISKQETHPRDGYPDTERFLSLVKPPMRATALIAREGGHNYATWGRQLPRALSWLSAQIGKPGGIFRDTPAGGGKADASGADASTGGVSVDRQ